MFITFNGLISFQVHFNRQIEVKHFSTMSLQMRNLDMVRIDNRFFVRVKFGFEWEDRQIIQLSASLDMFMATYFTYIYRSCENRPLLVDVTIFCINKHFTVNRIADELHSLPRKKCVLCLQKFSTTKSVYLLSRYFGYRFKNIVSIK